MQRFRILGLSLLILASSACQANTEANFRKAIGGICASFGKAFEARNADWYEQNSTKDMIYVNSNGQKQEKKQVILGMRNLFKSAKTLKTKVKCGAVQFRNGIGSHINTVEATVGIPDNTGKLHTMVMTATTEDAFRWDGGKWKYFRVTEIKAPKYVVDGKVISAGPPPKKPAGKPKL